MASSYYSDTSSKVQSAWELLLGEISPGDWLVDGSNCYHLFFRPERLLNDLPNDNDLYNVAMKFSLCVFVKLGGNPPGYDCGIYLYARDPEKSTPVKAAPKPLHEPFRLISKKGGHIALANAIRRELRIMLSLERGVGLVR